MPYISVIYHRHIIIRDGNRCSYHFVIAGAEYALKPSFDLHIMAPVDVIVRFTRCSKLCTVAAEQNHIMTSAGARGISMKLTISNELSRLKYDVSERFYKELHHVHRFVLKTKL